MNEFVQTRSVFRPFTHSDDTFTADLHGHSSGILTDINELANIPQEERYTYVYDQHSQEIDHIFVSNAIARRGGLDVEHVHVNTWAKSTRATDRASDHDPTVARVRVCDSSIMNGECRRYDCPYVLD